MDLETAIFLLKVSGTILLIAVSAVGYFVTRFLKAVDQLTVTVAELKTCVRYQKEDSEIIFRKLEEHSEMLGRHETDIEILKEKVK